MNYSSVLIVTYGRSGSTLLQGLLNSIDGCLVRGENDNFCVGLFEAYRSLVKARREFGTRPDDGPTYAWFGSAQLDEQRFLEDARTLVMHQLLPPGVQAACVGFKEVRYPPGVFPAPAGGYAETLVEYLDFLAKLFPNPAFIVLTRDLTEVARSAWWANMPPAAVRERLEQFEAAVADYARDKPWVFSLTYDDLVRHTGRLTALFEFLGTVDDRARTDAVLRRPHGYASDAPEPDA